MSQQKIVRLRIVGYETTPEEGKPTPRFGIQLAVGGEMLSPVIGPPEPGAAPQLMVAVLESPNPALVFTPLHVAGLGEPMQPLLGRRVGKLVGVTQAPTGLPVFVFLDEAAASGLSGMETKGNG